MEHSSQYGEGPFLELKKCFTEEPVLMMLDQACQFIMEADASKYASGAVLQQEDKEGKVHPCTFISKMFPPTEQKYMIYDCELLAILRALREWRPYIISLPYTTIVNSDHQNLTYHRKHKD